MPVKATEEHEATGEHEPQKNTEKHRTTQNNTEQHSWTQATDKHQKNTEGSVFSSMVCVLLCSSAACFAVLFRGLFFVFSCG
jgi:heme/copper-type cytochrome/quinol oxidase subunit 3